MEKRLLNVAELASYLSLPKSTIYTWVHTGEIPSSVIVKFGRALRFEKEAIDKWVSAKRSSPQLAGADILSDHQEPGAL